jgi:serine/threonine protein kinase
MVEKTATIEDFEIVKKIGAGAYGKVFLSKHKATGEFVAVK